jgi:hypothetical protein
MLRFFEVTLTPESISVKKTEKKSETAIGIEIGIGRKHHKKLSGSVSRSILDDFPQKLKNR